MHLCVDGGWVLTDGGVGRRRHITVTVAGGVVCPTKEKAFPGYERSTPSESGGQSNPQPNSKHLPEHS